MRLRWHSFFTVLVAHVLCACRISRVVRLHALPVPGDQPRAENAALTEAASLPGKRAAAPVELFNRFYMHRFRSILVGLLCVLGPVGTWMKRHISYGILVMAC